MKITSAEFVKGIRGTDDILADGVPQIAFVGRSNVGKSSVINSLTNKKDLVKVGKKPGKTTEINFFMIEQQGGACYFVDLPGYGYAQASLREREKIQKLILWYLTYSQARPATIVLIIDSKVGFTDFDREMLGILREYNHHYLIVANKIDKLNQKETSRQLNLIKRESPEADVIPYSAKTKRGVDALLERLFS